MIDSTNPRVMADNIRHLSGESESQGNAITALGSYSSDEIDTGKKWIDGSEIFRKVMYVEAMPNASTVTIAHGITNLGVMVSLEGVVQYHTGFTGRPIPYGTSITLRYGSVNIELQTQGDMSGESCYIILEYTKSAAPSPDLAPAPDDSRSIEPIEAEPIEEPVAEVKKTTRKKSTN